MWGSPSLTPCLLTQGILTALCEGEAFREQVIRGKSSLGNNGPSVLHAHLEEAGVDIMRSYAARILRLVAEDPSVGGRG